MKNSYLKIGIIVTLFLGFFYYINKIQSCSSIVAKLDNKPIVVPVKDTTLNEEEKKLIPSDKKIERVVKLADKGNGPRDKVIIDKIAVLSDPKCVTCTPTVINIVSAKDKFGFTSYPKFYIGHTNSEWTVGYAHEFFRYAKYGLNLNVTFPYVGATITRDLTNNFFVMLGLDVKYVQYNSIDEPGSYHFSSDFYKKQYPLIGCGFFF